MVLSLATRVNHFPEEIEFDSIFLGSSWQSFSKKLVKTDLPSRFYKSEVRNTKLFLFGRKIVVICCFVFCNSFPDLRSKYFKIKAIIKLRKILSRKKLFYVRLGNCSTPYTPIVHLLFNMTKSSVGESHFFTK